MRRWIVGFWALLWIGVNFGNSSTAHNSSVIQKYFGQHACSGTGTVYKFIIPAYDISLWTQKQPWSYNNLFALEVKARWDSSKTEMIESTIEVMKRNTPVSDAQEKEYTELLNSFYPDLKEKDLITVIYVPGEKILFYHNGILLKDIRDMIFARAFCDIWLSPKTKYASARRAMLGEKHS